MYNKYDTLVVHHSQDMDGLFSQIIAEEVFNRNENCMFLSYDYYNDESIIDEYLDKLNNAKPLHIIFIDVTASEKWYKNNVDKLKITIIDHHYKKLDSIYRFVFGEEYKLVEADESEVLVAYSEMYDFGIFYSANSATKTLEMFSRFSIQRLRKFGFLAVNEVIDPRLTELIKYVDYYDVWKWEKDVIECQKLMNDSQYNLYELAKGIKAFPKNYAINMIEAVNAYMFNYSLNKTFKQTREIDLTLLKQIGLIDAVDYDFENSDDYRFSANPTHYPTELMLDYILNQLVWFDDYNFQRIIKDGYNQYIKDYEEVEKFFNEHPNYNSIVTEVRHKGFHYVIVNYKFSNVIRDYFYNNYLGINFILLPRFEDEKFKVTGRTIKQNSFNVGELMLQKYNGGGHFNAGGGSIKADEVDIKSLNHVNIVNDFIDTFYNN